ncbi:hypothetical protein OUZ56_008100 [Daphnia magna]|uniref:Uncharacterized protein n=1 Tax=Daphnia magna TaxID=35525 RepID=A0ABR0AC39_9CRUS|nr:hypothetical protein OUZ56_008100 [Daphnia magna]
MLPFLDKVVIKLHRIFLCLPTITFNTLTSHSSAFVLFLFYLVILYCCSPLTTKSLNLIIRDVFELQFDMAPIVKLLQAIYPFLSLLIAGRNMPPLCVVAAA